MGPTVTPTYDIKRNHWFLLWGTETFYDEERHLRAWDTEQEAVDWVKSNHPELKIVKKDTHG